MKDGVEIEISEGELLLGGLAGVCWIGVCEDLLGVCEYVVKKIILEVPAGERVAVAVPEGDDLFLLFVRSGNYTAAHWAGGGARIQNPDSVGDCWCCGWVSFASVSRRMGR